jgi:transcription-repair coupling factor (superfamily II helicase)
MSCWSLYAAREEVHGHAFGKDVEWQAELEASFSVSGDG